MKSITLTQPWATLVAIGAKQIETRSWNTGHRGVIAIHAAATFPRKCARLATEMPFKRVLAAACIDELPTGAIIAVAEISHTYRFDHSSWLGVNADELPFGDFGAGRYGFVLRNVQKLATPVPCKGSLSIWTVKAAAEAAVLEQLGGGR